MVGALGAEFGEDADGASITAEKVDVAGACAGIHDRIAQLFGFGVVASADQALADLGDILLVDVRDDGPESLTVGRLEEALC